MIDKPQPREAKRPRLLIIDNGPISVPSEFDGALDWLFKPGCDLWMTDMVLIEARRAPRPGGRLRRSARANFENWFRRNTYRIRVVDTQVGRCFSIQLTLWDMAGRPEGMEPDTADLGEASILSQLKTLQAMISEGETVIVLMDDRAGRAAVRAMPLNIDLMGTQTFIAWMAEDFGVREAETAWAALEMILGEEVDPGESDDPVYIRNHGMI